MPYKKLKRLFIHFTFAGCYRVGEKHRKSQAPKNGPSEPCAIYRKFFLLSEFLSVETPTWRRKEQK